MTESTISRDTMGLAGLLAASGVTHLVRPQMWEPLMPSFVPRHHEVILASGVAELLCAAGLLHPRTRSAAGWASAALLLAVYPANVKMAADAKATSNPKFQAVAFGRLPLQVPLIWSAIRAARGR